MNYETVDILYRSRKTLLSILASKGYDTSRYDKFGPFEIESMYAGVEDPTAFKMELERAPEAADKAAAPRIVKCLVLYSFQRMKGRVSHLIQDLINTEESGIDPATTEIVMLLLDKSDVISSENVVFDTAAASAWKAKKLRIAFFQARTLVINPLLHQDVPKHELVSAAEHTEFLAKMKIKSKSNLPIIRFHNDMIARVIGAMPDDIVKITRPSPSAGEYTTYRVCKA
jgi:DNA-directed RNA polymerase subunit H